MTACKHLHMILLCPALQLDPRHSCREGLRASLQPSRAMFRGTSSSQRCMQAASGAGSGQHVSCSRAQDTAAHGSRPATRQASGESLRGRSLDWPGKPTPAPWPLPIRPSSFYGPDMQQLHACHARRSCDAADVLVVPCALMLSRDTPDTCRYGNVKTPTGGHESPQWPLRRCAAVQRALHTLTWSLLRSAGRQTRQQASHTLGVCRALQGMQARMRSVPICRAAQQALRPRRRRPPPIMRSPAAVQALAAVQAHPAR